MAAQAVYDVPEWMDDSPLADGEVWKPEPDLQEEESILKRQLKVVGEVPAVTPSQFTQFAFRMPVDVGGGRIEFRPFSFTERPHMVRCYDTPAKNLLLMCGRQVEKSTLLGNIMLSYSCMVPGYRTLYVAPSNQQADVFSKDRLKEPVETSSILANFTTKMLSSNILEKQFVNRSKITLRYAYLNADRCRGIPAWNLSIDEIQDILSDNIPVIEQCISHAPEHWKRQVYSGTPKSFDNTIEEYWAEKSTQNEWVVPCDACNHWNILGETNIQKKGLSCEKCSRLINPQHPRAQWARMQDLDGVKVAFEGYRIPQLMVPWKPWSTLYYEYQTYPRARFYNEVLGRSYDSGQRPLTKDEIMRCCRDNLSMQKIDHYRERSFQQSVYAGIDWGTGENSYTVITLATYVDNKFRVFYQHRFVGSEVEPDVQMDLICQLLDYFNVRLIGVDYGGGFHPNDKLTRRYGKNRVFRYQYASRAAKKVTWTPQLSRYVVRRGEVMADFFNAIKDGRKCEFPRWEEWEKPHAEDMLNIFSEYNDALHMTQYKHAAGKPDDCYHSLLYAWLVSMLEVPRPDIITADKTDKTGVLIDQYDQSPFYVS
jgi:hypothetical protein